MSKMQAPRGCPDLFPNDVEKRNHILKIAKTLAENYGFQEHETPIFEHSEVFEKNLGETSDIVSKEMYTFTDKGGERLTLRPEATASIARLFISHKLFREIPYKVFYQGPMFRHERPQMGRQRQFTQIGVESLGVKDPKIEAETIELGWKLISALGLSSNSTVLINTLGTNEDREVYKKSLVQYLEKFNSSLSEDSQKRLITNPLRILDSKDDKDKEILLKAPLLSEFINPESQSNFKKILDLLSSLNVPYKIEPQLVRGLDYYTDTVFEIVNSNLGAQSTVLAGGRYDKMIESMGGPDCPSFGWASGLERLALLTDYQPIHKVKIGVVDINHSDDSYLMKVNSILRNTYPTYWSATGNFSKQMKKCESNHCNFVVLFGDDEINNKSVQIKNLKTGEQTEVKVQDLANFKF